MTKKQIVVASVIVAALGGIVAVYAVSNTEANKTPAPYDAFAQCLTENGAKMYGAYWCPHCQNQKEAFGSSWKYVEYVECSLPNQAGQTLECKDAGIDGYPTWEFADGSRIGGEASFEELSLKTECQLPE